MSRSQIFEEALAGWIRRRAHAKLDAAIERYYRTQGVPEREEDEPWASLGDDTVRRRWDG